MLLSSPDSQGQWSAERLSPDFSFLLSSELPALKACEPIVCGFSAVPIKKEAVCLYLLSPTVCLITTTPALRQAHIPRAGIRLQNSWGLSPSYIASARNWQKHLVCLFASLTSSAEKLIVELNYLMDSPLNSARILRPCLNLPNFGSLFYSTLPHIHSKSLYIPYPWKGLLFLHPQIIGS